MLFLKYLLLFTGSGLLAAAAGILAYDLYRALIRKKEEGEGPTGPSPASLVSGGVRWGVRWNVAQKLAACSVLPLLAGLSITVVPAGSAGVRLSQFSGASSSTLYPGVHFMLPLGQSMETFNVRDIVYTTSTGAGDPKLATGDVLKVQTKEGLEVGLALAIRYRIDPSKLAYVYTNLPQPVEREMVPPVVASVFREIAPNYQVRELFATKRDEIRRLAADRISQKLGADGIQVKEVMLRDIHLPDEFAKSLEGVLLKEQENERLTVELDVKQKMVRVAELEAEALKAREVKAAEGQAQVTVLQAKAQADAMQYKIGRAHV